MTTDQSRINKPYEASVLCQLNGGCMGCCGHSFESNESIKEAIHKNTLEFKDKNPKAKEEFIEFRDRHHTRDLRNGVCRNLVQIDKQTQEPSKDQSKMSSYQVLCPLHPTRHGGEDLRIGHCDIYHLCKTAKEFKTWDKQSQEEFLQFIKQKKLDNINYSMQMSKHTLLNEFQELNSKNPSLTPNES